MFGSELISLSLVVIAHPLGSDTQASKNGLFHLVIGLRTLARLSAVYAILGDSTKQRW